MKNLTDSPETLIHSFEIQKETNGISYGMFVIFIVIVLIAGGLSGFGISKFTSSSSTSSNSTNSKSSGTVVGTVDKKTFKDSAEGILKEGGIDGEGNFHLERPGGISQNVYLTSATVDLSQFVGKKVKVWGATFQGQKAGWLMDVGSVEIL